MSKSSHFTGQPIYSQLLSLLDKCQIMRLSQEHSGERYTKRFDAWTHLVVMLYAVIKCFDSLREIAVSLLAEAPKLQHLGISTMGYRSTLSDANKCRPEAIYVTKMKKNLRYRLLSDTMVQAPEGLMELRLQEVIFSKTQSDGTVLQHKARLITYPEDKRSKLTTLLTNDLETDPYDLIQVYRTRWEIELLFKQLKQNFPLRYFYGESANAIKIQIWITLLANLLLMVLKARLKRAWSFSGLATIVRICLMYYADVYTLLEHPER